jgi:hypothetical protein
MAFYSNLAPRGRRIFGCTTTSGNGNHNCARFSYCGLDHGYRVNLPGFELPESVRVFQQEYDDHSARVLEDLADQIESNSRQVSPMSEDSFEHLEQKVHACYAKEEQPVTEAHIRSFMTLLRGIDALTTSLAEEITMEQPGLHCRSARLK